MSDTGRCGLGLETDTLGLGLGPLLFPLLSLYLGAIIDCYYTYRFYSYMIAIITDTFQGT